MADAYGKMSRYVHRTYDVALTEPEIGKLRDVIVRLHGIINGEHAVYTMLKELINALIIFLKKNYI